MDPKFASGQRSYGLANLGTGTRMTSGKIYFVNNTYGSDDNPGDDVELPLKTLDYAVGRCRASRGDTIIVMEGSNETISSTVVVDVAGISIIGLGHGQAKAMLTCGTTGSDNIMEISAANVLVENLYFKGAGTGTNEVFIDIQGVDDITIRDCIFEHGSKNLDAITVTSGTDNLVIEGCRFWANAAGADTAILYENVTAGGVAYKNLTVRNCHFDYTQSSGCDEGVICISMSSGTMTGMLIRDCTFMGLADGERAINAKGQAGTNWTAGTSLAMNVNVLSADATDVFIVTNVMGYINCFATEAGKRPYGAISGSGGSAPPLATAAV